MAPVMSAFCDKFREVYAAKFEDVRRLENDPSKFLEIPFDQQIVNAQLSERFSRQLTARDRGVSRFPPVINKGQCCRLV